jgi:hypothetical protein
MKQSITLYDALTSISMPSNKAKAVIDAWESDVEKLASKSDLAQNRKTPQKPPFQSWALSCVH